MIICLVHGGWMGAWCWEPLLRQLRSDIRTVVVDLPIGRAAGVEQYAEIIIDELDGMTGDVLLVGHSMGGLVVPVVAERRPVCKLVLLCAAVPEPGRSVAEQMLGDPPCVSDGLITALSGTSLDDDGLIALDRDVARQLFFDDCSNEVAAWALDRIRPQHTAALVDPSPLASWPDVPCHYILCTDDPALNPQWSREAAGKIAADLTALPGGHSPFLSRPAQLAQVLLNITAAH